MSEKIKKGQIWERKDVRGGITQVEVLMVRLNQVTVQGRRRSTININRFPKDYRLVQDV